MISRLVICVRTPSRAVAGMALLLMLAACSNPAATPAPVEQTETPSPFPSSTVPVPATPSVTPLPLPTKTLAPTPTLYITPPPAGQAAAIPILMYHHVTDLPESASEVQRTWTVSPKAFEAQIKWLGEHDFHTVTMAQVGAFFSRGQPLPAKPIVISFDDGWEDDYTAAFPVLKRYGFSGTFFVYTQALDHKQFLTWKEIEEMSATGMDFQSHTVSHARLRLLGADAALKELVDSKAILEKRVGNPVTSLAYPDGEYNASVIDLVKRAGYTSAVTIASGYKQRADELYTLHRIRVTYTDTLQVVVSRLP